MKYLEDITGTFTFSATDFSRISYIRLDFNLCRESGTRCYSERRQKNLV
jgi:hypothetical protein